MKPRQRKTYPQIIQFLKLLSEGRSPEQVAGEAGISLRTLRRWRSRYADVPHLGGGEEQNREALRAEIRRLIGIIAELIVDRQRLRELLARYEPE